MKQIIADLKEQAEAIRSEIRSYEVAIEKRTVRYVKLVAKRDLSEEADEVRTMLSEMIRTAEENKKRAEKRLSFVLQAIAYATLAEGESLKKIEE